MPEEDFHLPVGVRLKAHAGAPVARLAEEGPASCTTIHAGRLPARRHHKHDYVA